MIWDAAITRLGRPSAHWFSLFKADDNPQSMEKLQQLSYLPDSVSPLTWHHPDGRPSIKNTRVAAPMSPLGLWEAGNQSAYTSDDEGLWYACRTSRRMMQDRFGTRVVWNKAYYRSDPGPPGRRMYQSVVQKCLVVEPQDLIIITRPQRTTRPRDQRKFRIRDANAAWKVIGDCAEY